MFKLVFVFSVLAVSLRNVRTVSPEEKLDIHAATLPHVVECSAEFEVTVEDFKKAMDSGYLATLDPCLMACLFKKGEMINDKGLFDSDKAKEFAKKYFSHEADQKKANEIISKCEKVNELEVSDGEKGCERSRLLSECFRPYRDMYAR